MLTNNVNIYSSVLFIYGLFLCIIIQYTARVIKYIKQYNILPDHIDERIEIFDLILINTSHSPRRPHHPPSPARRYISHLNRWEDSWNGPYLLTTRVLDCVILCHEPDGRGTGGISVRWYVSHRAWIELRTKQLALIVIVFWWMETISYCVLHLFIIQNTKACA